ncbi:MAG: hypothetical protein HLUCCA08_02095 [Rhodobacteraceae bacterium HLUCCA08]|nr:MAG: hypothetical protein HLUCCA08_02095 [Rhodobacteraceae bacterium HLUCCA08]
MAVCICLEPGQHYGCRIGPPGQPAELSFSVDGTKVRADFDWHRIGDRDWASLSITHDGITVTVRVGRPETPDGMPLGRIEITDHDTRAFDLDPATILHDLPFD